MNIINAEGMVVLGPIGKDSDVDLYESSNKRGLKEFKVISSDDFNEGGTVLADPGLLFRKKVDGSEFYFGKKESIYAIIKKDKEPTKA